MTDFVLAVRYSIAGVCGAAIVENLLAIAVFAGTKKFRIKYYTLVVNLALADLFFAIFTISSLYLSRSPVLRGLAQASLTVSLETIFAVAVNRYLALSLVPPARYNSLVTGYRLIGVCVILWCVGLAYGLATYLSRSNFDFVDSVVYPLLVGLVWVITAFLYFLAFRKIKQYTPPLASTAGISANAEQDHTRVQQTRRLLVLFVLILVVSCITWMPILVITLLLFFFPSLGGTVTFLWYVGFFLYTLSAMINPLVYWWRLDGFREGFYAMFCRCVIKAEPRQIEADPTTNENTVAETGL